MLKQSHLIIVGIVLVMLILIVLAAYGVAPASLEFAARFKAHSVGYGA
jgi:hypothetical protein